MSDLTPAAISVANMADFSLARENAFLNYTSITNRLYTVLEEAMQLHLVMEAISQSGDRELALNTLPQPTLQAITSIAKKHALLNNVSTEGVLSDFTYNAVAYIWKEIKILVMKIVDNIKAWITGIFTRRSKLIKTATWYTEHFKKHPIEDAKMRTATGTFPSCKMVIDRMIKLYGIGTIISPIMQNFKATGRLTWASMEADGHIAELAQCGFKIEKDGEGVKIASLLLSALTPETAPLGKLGWNAFSLQEALNHVVRVSESLDRLDSIKNDLTPSLVNPIEAKVKSEESKREYMQGVNLIDRLILLFSNACVVVSEDTIKVAEFSRKFCQ
jgi:hypothetical protein